MSFIKFPVLQLKPFGAVIKPLDERSLNERLAVKGAEYAAKFD
ncbi:MAG: hypothetical protein QXS01_05740 [Candidatus Bathyarchaeia archaeon]